jgi:hypothetical protein
MCRNDNALYIIGRRLFQVQQKKVDKDIEKRKSVMSDMRLLATLYMAFTEHKPDSRNLEEMFTIDSFSS